MRFSFLKTLLPLAALCSSVLAYPLEVRAGTQPFPDKAGITSDFNEWKNVVGDTLEPDTGTYFTGLNNNEIENLRDYAEQQGLVTLRDCWPTDYVSRSTWAPNQSDAAYRTFLETVSQVYAEMTEGVAYLQLDDGAFPASDSIFLTVEFPALRDGGKVTEIRRFPKSARPADPKTTYTVWWKQGDPDPTPP